MTQVPPTPLPGETPTHTPLPVVANISRVVTMVVDRITGDRAEYPLLVAAACVEALKNFGIESRIMYGQVAWIEVMPDHSVIWAGCWGGNIHFWVATQYGEVVDLNTSVAHRTRAHERPELKAIHSPPMLWSVEVPKFYRYEPEGVAELELTEERDKSRFEAVLRELRDKCTPEQVAAVEQDFPNEAILCPGRRLLDDSHENFKHFDRALAVRGVPAAPF
jgi:hypothetical protein